MCYLMLGLHPTEHKDGPDRTCEERTCGEDPRGTELTGREDEMHGTKRNEAISTKRCETVKRIEPNRNDMHSFVRDSPL